MKNIFVVLADPVCAKVRAGTLLSSEVRRHRLIANSSKLFLRGMHAFDYDGDVA